MIRDGSSDLSSWPRELIGRPEEVLEAHAIIAATRRLRYGHGRHRMLAPSPPTRAT